MSELTDQEKELTAKLECFILNHGYEFIEAMRIINMQDTARMMADYIKRGGCDIPPDTDMSYKIKIYMPLISSLRQERGA